MFPHRKNRRAKVPIWFLFLVIIGVVVLLVFVPKTRQQQKKDTASYNWTNSSIERADAKKISDLIIHSSAKASIVNMWATWCGPCVKEFPNLVRLEKNYKGKGLNVIFVSMDDLKDGSRVQKFLKKEKVDFATYIKNQSDNDFIKQFDSEWSGALPASFIFDSKGQLDTFWTGDATYQQFEKDILPILKKAPK